MKLIIAGTRSFSDKKLLFKKVIEFIKENNPTSITVISGMAQGADLLGKEFALYYGTGLIKMPAKWNDLNCPQVHIKYNKSGKPYNSAAGYIRNEEMAKIATHCIVFWDGKSKGTKNMIELANKYELKLKTVRYE
jgi:hypothetical protein